nr:phosphoribosylglycinamide formyltransferase [Millisia brevis]
MELSASPADRSRIVVLVSGDGSLLQAVLDAAADVDYPARVVAVIADRDCFGLRRAEKASIPATIVAPADSVDRPAWNDRLIETVDAHRPDWVISAGFMRILGPAFVGRFAERIVNTHPALLPAFPGDRAVADALAYGARVSGSTIHLVDEGVDTGPILAQEAVVVHDDDTRETLHERIKTVERRLLVDVVAGIAAHGVTIEGRKARIARE